MATLPPTRAMSSESSLGGAADTFSHVASLSSTPPTTVADSMSLASDSGKNDIAIASDPIDEIVHESVEAQTTPEPLHLDLAVETHKVLITEETLTTHQEETHKDTVVDQPAESADPTAAAPADTPADTPSQGRSRRARKSEPVYNIAKLSGTAIHGKRRSKGDIINDRKRRTISGTLPTDNLDGANTSSDGVGQKAGEMIQDGINALNMQWSMKGLDTPEVKNSKKRVRSPEPVSRRISTRSAGPITDNILQKISAVSKKGKKAMKSLSNVPRELRKLQDTNEFAKIDSKPVMYTVWAKGKFVDPNEPVEPPKKRVKTEEKSESAPQKEPEPIPQPSVFKRKANKKWLDRGLYSGQEAPLDIFKSLTPAEKKSIADYPELVPKVGEKPNMTLPAPMFNGLRFLIQGKDFKLPYDVCNPLPPGQPKPEGWRTMTKNRFVGGAGAYWKKTPHFKDYQSKCVCTPEDGCAESCQNRIMLYECDDTNCNSGSKYCQNRAFARLTERTKQGGKFRVGVEVVKTSDRGYGIRASRCFEPGQIIMEYTGEIITEEECDRRMNEKYKDNECYYLMSFDQNMIIDATTGSIARFVNHSCSPNCLMIKWIVSGQPRMALFAGDRPIMTGEELTYDYNFDPFSAKNVQKCLCGSPNCRGVLGPRPKEVKPAKQDLKKTVKAGVKAGKRKIQELIGDKEDGSAAKKRKIKAATGPTSKPVKRSVSSASLKVAKNAASKVVRKTVSTISVNTKGTKGGAKGVATPASSKKVTTVKRKSTVVKTYSKGKPTAAAARQTTSPKKTGPKKSVSRKSSLTIVAATGNENQDPQEGVAAAKKMALAAAGQEKSTPTRNSPRKSAAAVASPTPRKGLELNRVSPKIRLVQSPSKVAA
ncbi:histone-lysine N-methyltransferase ASH1L [Apiospora saccharicola]|uniref:Histone-lysine N-methyltransferase ASH1L n=1 Tax=Apiospora saccharicola TaxID=335842 RepID=A0ABR1V9G1_9PEZI